MFTRKTISSMPRRRMYFFRYMTMFFLGASAVMLATQALDISTSLSNAVQYIQQIVLTSDGSNLGTTGVFIDGAGKIGIGTDSPAVQLQINGTTGGIALHNNTDGNGNEMAFLRLNGVDRNNLTGGTRIFDYLGASRIRNLEGPIKLGAGLTYPNNPSITITTGGNVGIGTNSPSPGEALTVSGNIILTKGDTRVITLAQSTSGPGYDLGINAGKSASNSYTGGNLYLSAGDVPSGIPVPLDAGAGGNVYINGGDSEDGTDGNVLLASMRGNVGIGTDTPGAKLDVDGTGVFMGIGIGTNNPSKKLDVQDTSGNLTYGDIPFGTWNSSTLNIGAASDLGLQLGTTDPISGPTSTLGYRFIVGNDKPIAISTSYSANQVFYMAPDLYINTGGRVGIGTSNLGLDTVQARLTVNGSIKISSGPGGNPGLGALCGGEGGKLSYYGGTLFVCKGSVGSENWQEVATTTTPF